MDVAALIGNAFLIKNVFVEGFVLNGAVEINATGAHSTKCDLSCVIIGHRSLQNDLLAGLLKKRLRTHCFVSSVDEIVAMQRPVEAIALVDLGGDGCADLQENLSALSGVMDVLAIFNADKTSSYEWILRWPKIKGLFYRNTSEEQFVRGLRALMDNEFWLPHKMLSDYLECTRKTHSDISPATTLCLTRKEKEIILSLVSGASNSDIANHLNISPHTVKTHIYNLFRKINVCNRVQAVSWAHSNLDTTRR